MDSESKNTGWLDRVRYWINDPNGSFIIHKLAFALYMPILLIAIYGKIERKRFDGESSVDTMLVLAPELIFYSLMILTHIVILKSLKTHSIKRASLLGAVIISLLWLNFLTVESLGNIYGITTSNSDFDYSLIFHSLGQIDGLFAVFMSVIDPLIGVSALILLILYPLYLLHLFKGYKNCTAESTSGDRAAIKLLTLCILIPALYLAVFGAGRGRDVPLPISLSAIERSVTNTLENISGNAVAPIRQHYGLDTVLEKKDPSATAPNLVVIVLESTRHLSTLGSAQGAQIAPFLHSLQAKSTTYDRAYAMVPHTSKSLEGLYCSVEPTQGLALVAANPIVGIPSRCMAGFLKDVGYDNIFISTAPSGFEDRITFLKNAGFDGYILAEDMEPGNFSKVNYFGYEDKIMLKYAKNWLEKKGDSPFFMSLLTITPHHDYILPKGYALKDFASDPTLNNYLNTLRYQDEFLQELMEVFESSGHADNTLFVIVGDHGEAFGEHGKFMHDTVLYDEGTRVPLMFFGAGTSAGKTSSKAVSLIDIMPTAFAKMGLTLKADGKDIIGGVDADIRGQDRPVFSYCYREQLCSSIIKQDWKLIYNHGYSGNELFNLKSDPGELENLLQSEPERAASMEQELTQWLASVRSYNQQYFKSRIGKD